MLVVVEQAIVWRAGSVLQNRLFVVVGHYRDKKQKNAPLASLKTEGCHRHRRREREAKRPRCTPTVTRLRHQEISIALG